MINFPALNIDEDNLNEIAKSAFLECANNMFDDDESNFRDFFGNYSISELNTVLTKIGIFNFNEDQDIIHFDQSTAFHIEVKLHVFAKDEDGDLETLAGYTLMFNSNFEVVDDFLH